VELERLRGYGEPGVAGEGRDAAIEVILLYRVDELIRHFPFMRDRGPLDPGFAMSGRRPGLAAGCCSPTQAPS
jgi:hypothetical protein